MTTCITLKHTKAVLLSVVFAVARSLAGVSCTALVGLNCSEPQVDCFLRVQN